MSRGIRTRAGHDEGDRSKRRRYLVPGAVVLSACVLASAALWRSHAQPVALREAGLDVLLVTIDTLRADALGAYGRKDAITPWFDRLASEGVRFDFAHAHAVTTLPSHASLLSGRYPFDHGVRDNSGFRFPAGMDTLATLLAARGYRTGAFVSAFTVASRFGLGRGFEVYDDRFLGARREAFLLEERTGARTVALARRWLDATDGRPSFCWVHVFEPHYPYAPEAPFAARFAAEPYLGEVAAADDALRPLLQPVLEAGRRGRTLVVLTADHGESLGEHGEATHGIFAYEATLRVPLVLYQPRLLRPRVVPDSVRHVDVLPTILDALALPVPRDLPGRSLLPLARGEQAAEADSYFEALSGQLNRGWAPLRGVLSGRTKYVDLPLPELFELRSDPGEARNLVASRARELDELRRRLAALRSADRGVARVREAADVRERLNALGYVAAPAVAPEAVYGEDDDPKRLIALDALLQQVIGRHREGNLQAALEACRELVKRRPRMSLSLLHLAQLEREAGNLPGGIAALERALAANPRDTTALALLGSYLVQAGRARDAVRALAPEAAAAEPDPELLASLALAQARVGRVPEALKTLERARRADPQSALLLLDLGTVRLTAGDAAGAVQAFESALAANPGLARAHSSLGFVRAQQGGTASALDHWRAALELEPRECEALLSLASLAANAGGEAAARPYLELFLELAPRTPCAAQAPRVATAMAEAGRGTRRPDAPSR
jgi:choline-sulfatase